MFVAKVIKIRRRLLKLQLKMSGILLRTQVVGSRYQHSEQLSEIRLSSGEVFSKRRYMIFVAT